jgi:catechol 2,3-dioxygenase-like lactoylglutathione lyase family enzyme
VRRPIDHLDYVVLLCDDIESMRAFYRDVMELPLAAGLISGWNFGWATA